MKNKVTRLIGSSVLAAVTVTGCGWSNSMHSMQGHSMHEPTMSSKDTKWSAADLRSNLNALLGEHVLTAAGATSHALGGREAAFKGAVGGLDATIGGNHEKDCHGLVCFGYLDSCRPGAVHANRHV